MLHYADIKVLHYAKKLLRYAQVITLCEKCITLCGNYYVVRSYYVMRRNSRVWLTCVGRRCADGRSLLVGVVVVGCSLSVVLC